MESISRPYTSHELKLIEKALRTITPTKLPDATNITPITPYDSVSASLQRRSSTVYSKMEIRRDD